MVNTAYRNFALVIFNTMRLLFLSIFCALATVLAAQTTQIDVVGTGCKAMNLYAFNGVSFTKTGTFKPTEDGNWTLTETFSEPTFRYVGSSPQDALPLVLGDDERLTVTGTCNKLSKGVVSDSPINARYAELKNTFQQHNRTFSLAMKAFNTARRAKDTITIKQETAALAALDTKKKDLLEATKAEYPLLAKVITLNTYLSFVADNQGRYTNELDYFVNTYFQFVDFTDEGYGDLPWTYEGSRNFSQTLAQVIPGEKLGDILMKVYDKWPAKSRARMFALSGGFASLSQKKHPAALRVAETLVAEYKDLYPAPVSMIEQQIAALRTFAIGATAPDFSGPSPEGETISLSSLRGKVVLIDFWASWCGPCRKENPNVVRLYNQYKDKGFEILGVSLDRTKGRWEQAIADDNLTWLHISDLKGWRSKYAQQYGVSSIPQTVLLDADGNIIARNLRGGALAAKLQEIFAGK